MIFGQFPLRSQEEILYFKLGTIHKGRQGRQGRPNRGGRGVGPKADIVRGTRDQSKIRTRGGRGSKIPKILRKSFICGPLPGFVGIVMKNWSEDIIIKV